MTERGALKISLRPVATPFHYVQCDQSFWVQTSNRISFKPYACGTLIELHNFYYTHSAASKNFKLQAPQFGFFQLLTLAIDSVHMITFAT